MDADGLVQQTTISDKESSFLPNVNKPKLNQDGKECKGLNDIDDNASYASSVPSSSSSPSQ